jgi:hypothetical protein
MNGASAFDGMSVNAARAFAAQWLPAWTGNQPERLLSFYNKDVFYLDPAVPHGLQGKDALRAYFNKLLSRNPDWVWEQIDATPMRGGFVNKWRARMPPLHQAVVGVCTVAFDADNLIVRNEVYFDRRALSP